MNPQSVYAMRLADRRAALLQQENKHRAVGSVRLLVAAVGVAMAGAFVFDRLTFSAWWLLAPLLPLFALGVWLERLEEAAAACARAIAFYERAIARLEGTWPGTGNPGARFLDERHVYARDLDLFGEGSLFDLLCNARTPMGEDTLAAWLLQPPPPAGVRDRQEAVTELTPRLDLHEQLAVVADDVRTGVAPASLAAWGARAPRLQSLRLRAAAWALTAAGVTAFAAILAHVAAISEQIALAGSTVGALRAWFLIVILVIGTMLWRLRRDIGTVIHEADAASARLTLLAGILRIIEAETFQSPGLIAVRSALDTDGRPPSSRIAQLLKLMSVADMRHNWFIQLLGPFVLFDLHVAFRLEDWRRSFGPSVGRWLDAVGELEAIGSLANYRHGRPHHALPEFVDEPGRFESEGLGHPLLDAAVTNDVAIVPPLQVLIVSGSNMSGKSTLLRTVGINVVLARAGAPVYATRMRLSPFSVAASIRIQDSLRQGRSRFYAEILRLKQIIDTAEQEPPALFLIDEFLHGTNSHDRLIGAAAIVRALVERGAIGLVTTHDLALTNIVSDLGPKAANVHFQDFVENGQLHFDYRMQPGIVSRSNAVELMRSVGLDI